MVTSPIVEIRALEPRDPPVISDAFRTIGWDRTVEQYERYLDEQETGHRDIRLAEVGGRFAGYITVRWQSDYPPFAAAGIPEIQDLNVLPVFRRRGIGSKLLDTAEDLIGRRAVAAGIGVGLFGDYGAAQRLYVRRGYLPDGRGIVWNGRHVLPGEHVRADDDLVLYFTRALAAPPDTWASK